MLQTIDRYFQVDPWKVVEKGFDPSHGQTAESIFSLGNEFMGVRGYFEEGYGGGSLPGSYINGVYVKNVLKPFWCKGLAHSECYMVNCADWLYARISVDGERLDLAECKFHNFKRVLDMKKGTLSREFTWETSGGKLLKLSFLRFTSMEMPNLGCQRITFEPVNFSGMVEIRSCLDFSSGTSGKSTWTMLRKQNTGETVAGLVKADNGGQQVFSAFKLNFSSPLETKPVEEEKLIGLEFSLPLAKGKQASFDKMGVSYAERRSGVDPHEVWRKGTCLAEKYSGLTFEKALEGQIKYWADTWDTLNIIIEGDPESQQGVRFSLLNLYQAYRGADDASNIGDRGLTGRADGGRTWWTAETFCLPFYLFNNPEAARNLLEYRYRHLPRALERAEEVDCAGACYPLTTLDGTESCTWWEHSMLKIHASASVPYGIRTYGHLCRDRDFLYTHGIEMLLQSCRYFASRGQWSQLTGEFGFYGVMGADELHMMVHNNCYTNVMAIKTFEHTLRVICEMKENALSELNAIFAKIGLAQSELDDWRQMAEKMRISFDEKTCVYKQHDGFFDLPHIDVNTIPDDQLPVELHWAYDRTFRYDMTRLPGVLMLMLLFSGEYSIETKRANYEYYEPRCSHESPYSPAILSILAAELGKHREAYEYARSAIRLDLDNACRDTGEGLHVTSMAQAWMNIVYGFGGMRPDGDKLSFNPSMPRKWDSFSFNILYQDTRLNVKISRRSLVFKVCAGPAIAVEIFGKVYTVDSGGIDLQMPAERLE